jgi:hypothetical protein
MTTIYHGYRDRYGAHVYRIQNGRRYVLRLRRDLDDHSPTGFSWGYHGSGCAQLALALLADVLGNDIRAIKLHQYFKRRVIAALEDDEWSLTPQEIKDHAYALEAEIEAEAG